MNIANTEEYEVAKEEAIRKLDELIQECYGYDVKSTFEAWLKFSELKFFLIVIPLYPT